MYFIGNVNNGNTFIMKYRKIFDDIHFAFNMIKVVDPWCLINYLGNALYYEFNIKKRKRRN